MVKASKTNKDATEAAKQGSGACEDIAPELIKSLNKELGTRVAFNLNSDDAPVHVKRWISTGSRYLDYILSGRRNGGVPEGRIIEISGAPSIGKSHIGFQLARTVQRMGGLAVYIDTENATPVDKLRNMGIDVSHRFVYCDTHCTEEVFQIMESTIVKAKSVIDRDIPILIVWDSVAATSPKAELEGDYDKDTIGLQARTISKGLRKITGVIGHNNVTLVCLNQIKIKIGTMYGDPWTTPGGNAIPFHASIRLRLMGGTHVTGKDGTPIGINVTATTIKNKLTSPFRKAHFAIHFGKGIVEHEQLFDILRTHCEKCGPVVLSSDPGKVATIEGTGGWKTLRIVDAATKQIVVEKKFTKNQFGEMLDGQEYGACLDDMLESALVVDLAGDADATIDPETGEVTQAVQEAEE